MAEEFCELWKRVTGHDEERAQEVREILENFYSRPGRKYHNMNHIKDCLSQLDDFRRDGGNHGLTDSQLDEVAVALWFHDVIFKPEHPDTNKADSTALFEYLSLGLDAGKRERIERMIMVTDQHTGAVNSAERLVLEIDISILGRGKEEYKAYKEGVRSEFSYLSEILYRKRRSFMIGKFLDRERIFWTDYFHTKYESEARTNIKDELSELATLPIQEIMECVNSYVDSIFDGTRMLWKACYSKIV